MKISYSIMFLARRQDPYFTIAYQRNGKPITEEIFTLCISLHKKGIISFLFWKTGGEKSFWQLQISLKFSGTREDKDFFEGKYLKVLK